MKTNYTITLSTITGAMKSAESRRQQILNTPKSYFTRKAERAMREVAANLAKPYFVGSEFEARKYFGLQDRVEAGCLAPDCDWYYNEKHVFCLSVIVANYGLRKRAFVEIEKLY